jgi:phosphate transport system substrate-binding protein
VRIRHRVSPAAAALALAALAVVAFPAGAAQAAASVSGGGSTFAAPEIQQFASDTSGAPYNLQVNYAATGSGAGRENYAQGTYQYGTSDIVFTPNDGPLAAAAATQHPYRYVTVTAGGLGFMYNIVVGGQRWTGLNLTRQNVCQIFTGAITMWNDPRLVSTPGDAILASVDKRIQPVVRSDQAGESYVLSQYCLAVDRGDWLTFVNYVRGNSGNETQAGWNGDQDLAPAGNPNLAEPIEYWPPLLDGGDNAINRSGASNLVQYVVDPNTGSDSITYVAAVYAQDAGFPMASVQNQAGDYVQPNANSVQLALSYASPNSAGTFNLDFTGPNPGAYFPSTYSYILAPVSTNAPASAGRDQSMAEFLCFAVGQGQNDAARLLYAPLSREVTAISVQAIEAIPGAPPASQCGIGGPAPAVTPGQVVGNNGNPGPSGGGGGSGGGAGGTAGSSGSNSSAGGGSGGTGSGAGSSAGGSGSSPGGSGSSAAVTAAAGRRSASGAGTTSRTGAQAAGPGGSATTNGGPVSVPLQAIASGQTNSETYWYLLIGAAVCALGVGLVSKKGQDST